MKIRSERQLTRLLQVTIPRDAYILLHSLMQRRVEQDYAPSKVTKSAVMADAITKLAIAEGLIPEPVQGAPAEPKTLPFELPSTPAVGQG